MRKMKLMTALMALVLVLSLVLTACQSGDSGDGKVTAKPGGTNVQPLTELEIDPADVFEHADNTSVYDVIGSQVTIDMVKEKDGLAYVTVDGTEYELGMDFLSMAMVYNVSVPENSDKYKDAEDVYNEWWKLYIQRWNYLMPEVPLYSNQYFDLYSAKITDFETSPYWGPADAIVAAKSSDGAVILGSATDLSGLFRNSSWGKSSPGSSDLDVQNLTTGYSTAQSNKEGVYIWNMMALAEEPTSVINEDGTLTYTIKIKNDLKFSDGSPITAKNYIANILANSTAVSSEAGGSGTAGLQLVGFTDFNKYTGEGDTVYFEGVKMLDDYTFSVTYLSDYATYYYAMVYAAFSPDPLQLYLGEKGDIVVDPETKSCGLNADFYAKEKKDGKDAYVVASQIVDNLKWDSSLPYSGPYTVSNYDESTLTATLKRNPVYPGDTARGTASIDTITYVKIVAETQMDQFKAGQVDVLAGITGAAETESAVNTVKDNPDKYKETHYDRAGYGKLGFRADFGSCMFASVRQAIAYSIDRNEFSQTFTGGYGTVVHGPYYPKSPTLAAVSDEIKLNQYQQSLDSALQVLEADGWIYNADGTPYDASKGGVRYKKLSKEKHELTAPNLTFASVDNKYKVVKLSDGNYYMPLVVNYYGTQPNTFTDLLVTKWAGNQDMMTKLGMYIDYIETDFTTGVNGEYVHDEGAGFDGKWKLNAINFATGFTSAIYDYAFNWTINPDMYDSYSACYVKDEADFAENYKK